MMMTNNKTSKGLRIIFMGTPGFAVESLRALVNDRRNIAAVITGPDKPAGRGQVLKSPPVKVFALEKNLKVLQPENLKSEDFISQIRALNADLQVVVAFRILPEVVWAMPKLGTFNLHASLLPDYRGAAPINWAIINGETVTGVTTFFIDHNIDTGRIIFQEKVGIGPDENAGELHDRLMKAGAALVIKTIYAIERGDCKPVEQSALATGKEIKAAPKIYKEDCKINWSDNIRNIYNFIRGLSPYPAAWTELVSPAGERLSFKIFECGIIMTDKKIEAGSIESDGRSFLRIALQGGYLYIKKLQLAGRNKMEIKEFLKGFKDPQSYRIFMQ
jgi:methionyl-tRNA formyltransferase